MHLVTRALGSLTILASLTSLASAAAPPAVPADQAGIDSLGTSLVKGVVAALDSRDAAKLDPLIGEWMQAIDFRGAVDRAGLLAAMKPGKGGASTVSEVTCTKAGNAIVVTCLVEGGIDPRSSDATPRLAVFRPTDAGWRLAAWASLDSPETRPAPGAPSFAADADASAEGEKLLGRFLGLQHAKEMTAFDAMLDQGMQAANFRGCQPRSNIIRGAKSAETTEPKMADLRGTRCGDLLVVTCTLTLGQKIGWTTLPADPAPFLAVFEGTGDAAKVIATANTNKPK